MGSERPGGPAESRRELALVGSLPMLIAPVGFFAFMSLVFIPYEERRLRETFGGAYISFTQRVRRWM